MSNLERSVLASPGDRSETFWAGNAGDNQPGAATVSLTGSWSGAVTLYHALADGEYQAVTSYSSGPTEDIVIIGSNEESFYFEAASGFSGTARVIVAQGEVRA